MLRPCATGERNPTLHQIINTKLRGGKTMKQTNFIIKQLRGRDVFLLGFLLGVFVLLSCAHQQLQTSVSQFRFNLENQVYRIRSISTDDKTESYNELIGGDFLAADYDQDRILDCILMGDVDLNQAQKIYEYGLNEVSKENKLRVHNPSVNRYVLKSDDIQFEIRSFRSLNETPFNQFKITDSRPVVGPEVFVVVDQNADGTLDEILKGVITLGKAQSQYDKVIAAGLEKGELIKVNNTILVKEK